MRYRKTPNETVRRLPVYLRALQTLAGLGRTDTSSTELAGMVAVNPWQVRKDFSYFGAFGKRGSGYKINNLRKKIAKILRLDTVRKVALIGVGNLGSALLAYGGFETYGFDIAAAYDCDPRKVGKKLYNITVKDIAKLKNLKKDNIDLAIIAVPGSAAQDIANKLVRTGVKGILNFSPRHIQVPKRIKVITIDIAMDLARLPYYIS
jgi:redox-sensing transcriptional repressor